MDYIYYVLAVILFLIFLYFRSKSATLPDFYSYDTAAVSYFLMTYLTLISIILVLTFEATGLVLTWGVAVVSIISIFAIFDIVFKSSNARYTFYHYAHLILLVAFLVSFLVWLLNKEKARK
jgi:hypothetical protein